MQREDELTTDASAADSDSGPTVEGRRSRKENIVVKLKNLLPGQANSLGAIQCEDGSISKEPRAMAAVRVESVKRRVLSEVMMIPFLLCMAKPGLKPMRS